MAAGFQWLSNFLKALNECPERKLFTEGTEIFSVMYKEIHMECVILQSK